MRLWCVVPVLVGCSLACGASSRYKETLADVAGLYEFGDGRINFRLQINSDGSYWSVMSSCVGGLPIRGSASIKDGHVILEPRSAVVPSRREKELLDLVPVRWGDRRYLIPPRKYRDFCQQVNERWGEPRRAFYGSFYLRRNDWTKPVEGVPDIPPAWQNWLESESKSDGRRRA